MCESKEEKHGKKSEFFLLNLKMYFSLMGYLSPESIYSLFKNLKESLQAQIVYDILLIMTAKYSVVHISKLVFILGPYLSQFQWTNYSDA